jgi:hypothetical protein
MTTEQMRATLEQALDDMGPDGHCVCPAAKALMQAAISSQALQKIAEFGEEQAAEPAPTIKESSIVDQQADQPVPHSTACRSDDGRIDPDTGAWEGPEVAAPDRVRIWCPSSTRPSVNGMHRSRAIAAGTT